METDRLIIRRFEEKDLEDLYEYLSDPEVVKYEPYKVMSREETKDNLHYRIGSDEFYAVELKDTHKVIGNVYFGHRDFHSMELGYVFNYNYQKKGYATEACQAFITDAFAGNTHRIFAECDPQNKNSWILLERLGFLKEAHLKENVYFWTDENEKPIWKDTFIYSLLNPNR